MHASGHVSAQIAQPVHSSGRSNTADGYPARLIAAPITMQSFGQAGTHSSHALHRSKSISIRPVAVMLPSTAYSYFGLNSK